MSGSIQDHVKLEQKDKRVSELLDAAKKIKHWHDWGRDNEGMVVSSEAVRELWAARDALEKL